MLDFLIRKTMLKNAKKKTQDIVLKLIGTEIKIGILCQVIVWAYIFFMPLIPAFVMNCMLEEVKNSIQIIVSIIFSIHVICCAILVIYFQGSMNRFTNSITETIYFSNCTKKGNAISKDDFELIKESNKDLYFIISNQMCRRHCYLICFEILKTLKKGKIEFIAAKDFSLDDNVELDDKEDFTIHVLYINNGWAFDTFSSRQFPIEEIHKIFEAKIYKQFSYEDVKDKSYKQFRQENIDELAKWAKMNDCSMFWKKGEKED